MGIYLEESRRSDGNVWIWQTPNRQRYWGIGAMVGAGLIVIYSLRSIPQRVETLELVIGCAFLFVAILATTFTVKFSLNSKYQTYEFVKGFLPFLFGEKGRCTEAFECVAIRKEELVEGRPDDPNVRSFYSYKVLMVWKDPLREAMLLDSFPETYDESLAAEDFHAAARERAMEFSNGTLVRFLDQSIEVKPKPAEDDSAEQAANSASPA